MWGRAFGLCAAEALAVRCSRCSRPFIGSHFVAGPAGRDALEGKGPQGPPQERLGRRLEEVAKAVGGGYCRLQMPWRLALGVGGTVAGHRLGALEGGGEGVPSSPSNAPRAHIAAARVGCQLASHEEVSWVSARAPLDHVRRFRRAAQAPVVCGLNT